MLSYDALSILCVCMQGRRFLDVKSKKKKIGRLLNV